MTGSTGADINVSWCPKATATRGMLQLPVNHMHCMASTVALQIEVPDTSFRVLAVALGGIPNKLRHEQVTSNSTCGHETATNAML